MWSRSHWTLLSGTIDRDNALVCRLARKRKSILPPSSLLLEFYSLSGFSPFTVVQSPGQGTTLWIFNWQSMATYLCINGVYYKWCSRHRRRITLYQLLFYSARSLMQLFPYWTLFPAKVEDTIFLVSSSRWSHTTVPALQGPLDTPASIFACILR